tara:strand:- start:49861 stop:50892 length:1032 start_codon:yes stop_codon:yes gene_type:complete
MKAVIINEYGDIDKLDICQVPDPIPGPGEAIVRLKTAGINHLDHDVREGISGFPINLPHVPGIEGAGEVVGLGKGVTSASEGDRVAIALLAPCGRCKMCRSGQDNLCFNGHFLGASMWGTYAQYVKCYESQLVPLPYNLDYDNAAASHLCFGTAWHMAVHYGQVKAGMFVLVNAAGSGVGTSAIQIAKLHNANVIASAGSDEKLKKAKELGADYIVNYEKEDLAKYVLEITKGLGADLIIESVGGKVLTKSIESAAKGGTLVTCGAHAGEQIELDVIQLFRKNLRFQGSVLSTRAEMEHVFELVANKKLKPVIHTKMKLENVRKAAMLTRDRNFFGKLLLDAS